MKFMPFNIKTDYSLLSSLIKINDLFSFCMKENINYLAVCDNNLSSSLEVMDFCISKNIKYTIGIELSIENTSFCLYALSYIGYQNLIHINTLKELNQLNFDNLYKYTTDIACVLDINNVNRYDSFNIFKLLYIGYNDIVQRDKAKELTDKTLFNKELKCLSDKDNKYFKYLNELGGYNNLTKSFHIEQIDVVKESEYLEFFSHVNIVKPEKKLYIPQFCSDEKTYLRKLAYIGLEKRMGKLTSEYTKRIDYELEVITTMGFTNYFLIVYDYVCYAKKNDILVGPGRGSAAGSLVCYSIGITDIDPIKYDLLFERFLNVDRVTMPDIDIDFDSEKREEIINYVRSKYGNTKVAVGSAFSTFKTMLVLREVGRIKKVDKYVFERFLKTINRNISLRDNLNNEVVKKYLSTYTYIKEVYDISLKLENIKRNISTHAAGVVISSTDIDNVIPVYIEDNKYKTGFAMDNLENIGLLKMDFLSLKNLTVISNVLKEINLDLSSISLDEPEVLDLFENAKTDGIFQFETNSMKKLLLKLKPSSFDELIAAVALVRPGPSSFLDEYIKGKNDKSSIVYLKNLKPILEDTYGVILYQEQIIKILNVVGGFSNSKADVIRRAIAKKNSSIILSSSKEFMSSAQLKGYTLLEAEDLFKKIEKFADYGFNKSHSVAYTLIAYQMAYLKHYHSLHFVKEMLKGSKDVTFISSYLNEMKSKNVFAIKPDINYSKKEFTFINDRLVLPLNLIKNINSSVEDIILSNAPYKDFFEFITINKTLSKDVLKSLIQAGALRSFKFNIATLLDNLENAYIYSELNGYGTKPLVNIVEEFDNATLSNLEYEMYGFYISNHPSSKYKDNIMKVINKDKNLFKNINMVVKLEKITSIKTKKNTDMAFLKVSDETGFSDVTVFSDNYDDITNFKVGTLLYIKGKVTKNQDKINIVLMQVNEMEQ